MPLFSSSRTTTRPSFLAGQRVPVEQARSYMRQVFEGLAALHPKLSGVSCLRTFRVLRPLKTVTSVPGLRKIVLRCACAASR